MTSNKEKFLFYNDTFLPENRPIRWECGAPTALGAVSSFYTPQVVQDFVKDATSKMIDEQVADLLGDLVGEDEEKATKESAPEKPKALPVWERLSTYQHHYRHLYDSTPKVRKAKSGVPKHMQCSIPGGKPFGAFGDSKTPFSEQQQNFQKRTLVIGNHTPTYWETPFEIIKFTDKYLASQAQQSQGAQGQPVQDQGLQGLAVVPMPRPTKEDERPVSARSARSARSASSGKLSTPRTHPLGSRQGRISAATLAAAAGAAAAGIAPGSAAAVEAAMDAASVECPADSAAADPGNSVISDTLQVTPFSPADESAQSTWVNKNPVTQAVNQGNQNTKKRTKRPSTASVRPTSAGSSVSVRPSTAGSSRASSSKSPRAAERLAADVAIQNMVSGDSVIAQAASQGTYYGRKRNPSAKASQRLSHLQRRFQDARQADERDYDDIRTLAKR